MARDSDEELPGPSGGRGGGGDLGSTQRSELSGSGAHSASSVGRPETGKGSWGGPGLEGRLAPFAMATCASPGPRVRTCESLSSSPRDPPGMLMAQTRRSEVSQRVGCASSARRKPWASLSDSSLRAAVAKATDTGHPASLTPPHGAGGGSCPQWHGCSQQSQQDVRVDTRGQGANIQPGRQGSGRPPPLPYTGAPALGTGRSLWKHLRRTGGKRTRPELRV